MRRRLDLVIYGATPNVVALRCDATAGIDDLPLRAF